MPWSVIVADVWLLGFLYPYKLVALTAVSASIIPTGLLYFQQKRIYQIAKSMVLSKKDRKDDSGVNNTGCVGPPKLKA